MSLILGGSLHTQATCQASLGVHLGGLGLRHAEDTALPAYISSKIAAKPIVARLVVGLQSLDMLPESFENDYNVSLSDAVVKFQSGLDVGTVETVDGLMAKEANFVEKIIPGCRSRPSFTIERERKWRRCL